MKSIRDMSLLKRTGFLIIFIGVIIIISNGFLFASGNELSQKQDEDEFAEYVGFFNGIKGGAISLLLEKTYQIFTCKLSPTVVVNYKDETVDIKNILIHSIVKVILVDGLVEEIIILEVSS